MLTVERSINLYGCLAIYLAICISILSALIFWIYLFFQVNWSSGESMRRICTGRVRTLCGRSSTLEKSVCSVCTHRSVCQYTHTQFRTGNYITLKRRCTIRLQSSNFILMAPTDLCSRKQIVCLETELFPFTCFFVTFSVIQLSFNSLTDSLRFSFSLAKQWLRLVRFPLPKSCDANHAGSSRPHIGRSGERAGRLSWLTAVTANRRVLLGLWDQAICCWSSKCLEKLPFSTKTWTDSLGKEWDPNCVAYRSVRFRPELRLEACDVSRNRTSGFWCVRFFWRPLL